MTNQNLTTRGNDRHEFVLPAKRRWDQLIGSEGALLNPSSQVIHPVEAPLPSACSLELHVELSVGQVRTAEAQGQCSGVAPENVNELRTLADAEVGGCRKMPLGHRFLAKRHCSDSFTPVMRGQQGSSVGPVLVHSNGNYLQFSQWKQFYEHYWGSTDYHYYMCGLCSLSLHTYSAAHNHYHSAEHKEREHIAGTLHGRNGKGAGCEANKDVEVEMHSSGKDTSRPISSWREYEAKYTESDHQHNFKCVLCMKWLESHSSARDHLHCDKHKRNEERMHNKLPGGMAGEEGSTLPSTGSRQVANLKDLLIEEEAKFSEHGRFPSYKSQPCRKYLDGDHTSHNHINTVIHKEQVEEAKKMRQWSRTDLEAGENNESEPANDELTKRSVSTWKEFAQKFQKSPKCHTWKCSLCSKTLEGFVTAQSHLHSARHKKREAKVQPLQEKQLSSKDHKKLQMCNETLEEQPAKSQQDLANTDRTEDARYIGNHQNGCLSTHAEFDEDCDQFRSGHGIEDQINAEEQLRLNEGTTYVFVSSWEDFKEKYDRLPGCRSYICRLCFKKLEHFDAAQSHLQAPRHTSREQLLKFLPDQRRITSCSAKMEKYFGREDFTSDTEEIVTMLKYCGGVEQKVSSLEEVVSVLMQSTANQKFFCRLCKSSLSSFEAALFHFSRSHFKPNIHDHDPLEDAVARWQGVNGVEAGEVVKEKGLRTIGSASSVTFLCTFEEFTSEFAKTNTISHALGCFFCRKEIYSYGEALRHFLGAMHQEKVFYLERKRLIEQELQRRKTVIKPSKKLRNVCKTNAKQQYDQPFLPGSVAEKLMAKMGFRKRLGKHEDGIAYCISPVGMQNRGGLGKPMKRKKKENSGSGLASSQI